MQLAVARVDRRAVGVPELARRDPRRVEQARAPPRPSAAACRSTRGSRRRRPEEVVRRGRARSRTPRRGSGDRRGSSSAQAFAISSGCEVGGTSERSSSDTFETASRIAESCSWKRVDLVVGQLEAREPRDVQHLFPCDRHPLESSHDTKRRAPCGALRTVRFRKKAKRPERSPPAGPCRPARSRTDALTLVQGLVAVHRDRGEVDEHVVPALTLDEPEALLVRKPLDGAFCQRLLLTVMTSSVPRRAEAGETYCQNVQHSNAI